MKIFQAYRYELKPNDKQQTALFKHAGAARFVYNWGLARRIEEYAETGRSSNAMDQHKQLVVLKKTELSWLCEVSKCAPQNALRNLDAAFKNFFRRCKQGKKPGFPRFKKRGVHDSFRLIGSVKALGDYAQLPRIGKVCVKENTSKLKGRILSATVSREADRWFVSFLVERERKDPKPIKGDIVGVDLGIKCFAVLSNGERIEKPDFLGQALRLLRRRQKALSRKQKGSNNQAKARLHVARAHRRVRNQRCDFLNKLSSLLAKTKQEIVIEDLHVAGMIRNHKLARRIADAGWGEFRHMLGYKTDWYGSLLTVAPRFFPSTKRCSQCGQVRDEISLSERTFKCFECGYECDRDLNAALNLCSLAVSSTVTACREDVRHTARMQPQRSKNQILSVGSDR